MRIVVKRGKGPGGLDADFLAAKTAVDEKD